MKLVPVVVAWLGLVGGAAGCGGSSSGQIMPPVMTTRPDDFVLRDVRKDAARHLGCQVPNVDAQMGAWAGQEGNVIASGCGYQLTYYLRCTTNHQCTMTISD